jgi:peroxiredoxin
MARTAPARSKRVTVGEQFPTLLLRGLNDEPVQIPDPTGALTHLQFRRFAGCPVCNLHLRSISGRIEEINTAGIREVAVFHSTAAELRKYQDDMPFAVVGDPDKDLYRRFGVEASTKALRLAAWRALPGGYWHAIKTAIAKRRSPLPASPTNGNLGLPADLLIGPDGRILAAKYGSHAYDQWTVDEILATARQQ